MQKNANSSLGELKKETEQTRAGLTQTVEQLRTTVSDTASDIRQRLSPGSIKAEVSGYVRSRGERMIEDVTAAARRNPMQAVAVGAGIAYPLLKLVRAVPTPVLLIGAGLFLTGSKSGQEAVQKVTDLASDLVDEARRQSHDISDQLGSSVASMRDVATGAVDRVSEVMSNAADQLRTSASSTDSALDARADAVSENAASLAGSASARAGEFRVDVAGLANAAGGRASSVVSDTSSAVDALASTRDAVSETARELHQKAAHASDRAGKMVFQTIENNPLLVAGLGLVLGGLLASALPRSELEDNLVGEANGAAKSRARDVASRGFDAAKGAAEEILENVGRQASAEGLTPEGIDRAAKDIGLRVRQVADTAITTAFEPEKETESSSAAGEHHGR